MIRNRFIPALLPAVLGLLLAGCGGGSSGSVGAATSDTGVKQAPSTLVVRPADPSIPFETFTRTSFQSGIDDKRTVTVKDAAAWAALWAEYTGGAADQPMPQVDFSRNMVVAVFLGMQSNACSGVSIKAVKQNGSLGQLEVVYEASRPPMGVMCAQVVTSPAAFAVIPVSSLPVQFVEASNEADALVVRTGWSFGMCIGKCDVSAEIGMDGATLIATNLREPAEAQAGIWGAVTAREWETITANADTLPDSIDSCPDCADEGREWIEIQQGASVKRLDFSCNATVPGAEKLQDVLRSIRSRLAVKLGLSAACAGDNIAFDRVSGGVLNSAIAEKRFVTVKDQAAWTKLWREHTSKVDPAPDVPVIDFSSQMVLGVFVGDESPVCGSTAIETVKHLADPERIEVAYRTVDPGPNVMCFAAMLNQYSLVTVPASDLPVEFVKLK